MSGVASYLPRLVDRQLEALFKELSAILIVGPRAAGKTTTARRLAVTTVRLDQPAQAVAFRADPDAALRAWTEPILLDEWQQVPDVLGAVRRAVEEDGRPGRFLLTGSVRTDLLNEVWPGTGRLVRMRMFGLTVREQVGISTRPTFIDRLAKADLSLFTLPKPVPDLPTYVDMTLRGAFPEPLIRNFSEQARRAWLSSYLDQLLTHDIAGLVRGRTRVRRFFDVMALNSGGVPTHETLQQGAGVDYKTAEHYHALLSDLFILETLPAYHNRLLQRLVKLPKRYVVDPGLIGAALGVDVSYVLANGDLLGRMLDTFVMAQIRPELEVGMLRPRLYHLRDTNGRREVDIVGEMAAGIVGIEVKATAAPGTDDARHLIYLRDELKAKFLGGAILHTGPGLFALSDRIFAVPICALWG